MQGVIVTSFQSATMLYVIITSYKALIYAGRHNDVTIGRCYAGRHRDVNTKLCYAGRHHDVTIGRCYAGRDSDIITKLCYSGHHYDVTTKRCYTGRHNDVITKRCYAGRHNEIRDCEEVDRKLPVEEKKLLQRYTLCQDREYQIYSMSR